jgi:hypothetical protein
MVRYYNGKFKNYFRYVEDPPVINCCQFCAKSVKNKKQKCIYCNKLACEICFDKKFIPVKNINYVLRP